MQETIIGTVIGGIISLLISRLYYKKSGTDLQKMIGELSAQLVKLDEINKKIERRQSLQLESECQKAEGESVQIVKIGDDFGAKASTDITGNVVVVK